LPLYWGGCRSADRFMSTEQKANRGSIDYAKYR
jgi:hypothetical protein